MERAVQLLKLLADTITETADEVAPEGVPSGVVYSAMNGYGVSLDLYQSVLAALVDAGRVKVKSHLIYSTKEVTS